MKLEHEFSALRATDWESAAPQEDREEANQGAALRRRMEQHIQNVVMPLFDEAAEAARIGGYYGTAEIIVSRATRETKQAEVPVILGAYLGLSRRQRSWSPQCEGSIRLVHASGTIFTLSRKAPDFHVTDGASLDELGQLRLIEMVGEIIASTFK